jgi:hypothetical protein
MTTLDAGLLPAVNHASRFFSVRGQHPTVYLTTNLFHCLIDDGGLNTNCPLRLPRLNKANELSLGFYLFLPQQRYPKDLAAGVRLMGMLMIRCPKTGLAISTGRHIESKLFSSTPVFFSSTYCPHCRVRHEWFVKDAWVCDSDLSV